MEIRYEELVNNTEKVLKELCDYLDVTYSEKMLTLKQPSEKYGKNSSKITVGNIVSHSKFGKGEVLSLEGSGANQKAEIRFASVGVKKLLLQFAKLTIIS